MTRKQHIPAEVKKILIIQAYRRRRLSERIRVEQGEFLVLHESILQWHDI